MTSNGVATVSVSNTALNVTGNLVVSDTLGTNNFTITGDFGVGNLSDTESNLKANNANFNLINTVATKVNFAGAATTINMGATSGTLTINNPTIVGSQTTQSLFNTVATTINFGGAATTISIGNTSGTTTVNNDLVANGNIALNGGTLTTTKTTANVLNATATTINLGGAATAINVGATTGTLTVNNPTVVGSQTTQDLWNTVSTTINFGGAADINLSTSGKTTNVAGNLNVVGTTTISDDGNLYIKGGNVGEYLKANAANGQTIWANVNWDNLGTNDSTRGPTNGIALGQGATTSSADGISIGGGAGAQGAGIAIGKNAGTTRSSGSVEIAGTTGGGFFISPVRFISNAQALTTQYANSLRYDTSTSELVWTQAAAPTASYADKAGELALANGTSNVSFAGANGAVSIYATGSNTVVVSNTTAKINGILSVSGNASAGNITANNITANYFIGSGTQLDNITGANVTGNVTSANSANYATYANTISSLGTTQGNITSAANLATVGNVTSGIWSANIGVTSGANLTNIPAANIVGTIDSTVTNAVVYNASPITANGVALDAANVSTIPIVINGITYLLYAVPQ
jgi:hypothetical protein